MMRTLLIACGRLTARAASLPYLAVATVTAFASGAAAAPRRLTGPGARDTAQVRRLCQAAAQARRDSAGSFDRMPVGVPDTAGTRMPRYRANATGDPMPNAGQRRAPGPPTARGPLGETIVCSRVNGPR